MNLHAPERGVDETREAYRARRKDSAAAARAIERGPTQAPAVGPLDVSRFWLGQHTNPEANLRRRAKRYTSARQVLRHVRATRFYARTAP